jgi:UTP-glucose-1-phosphate uridylyltransferase
LTKRGFGSCRFGVSVRHTLSDSGFISPGWNQAPAQEDQFFAPRIFDLLEKTPPGKGGEIQLTDAIRMLIQQGGKVLGIRLSEKERRFDIGNFESYFRAFVEFALHDPRYGTELREYVRQLNI